jgi:hypothetical protein
MLGYGFLALKSWMIAEGATLTYSLKLTQISKIAPPPSAASIFEIANRTGVLL